MFSKQVKAIFIVLGNAFLTLARMTDDEADHLEMTGQQYIDRLDLPDVGKDIPVDMSNQAATVFAAASTFVAPPAEVVPVASAEPVYTMTDKANGFTREQYHEQKWTDATLVEHGMMTIGHLDPAPNVPQAAASTTQTASIAPPPASIPAAAPAAPQNTGAPAPAGAAIVDRTGLPWDVRIHASTRTQTKDGEWTKKRGTGDVFYNQVVAELRQATPAPAPVPFQPLTPPAAKPTTFAELCKWVTANGLTVPDMVKVAAEFGIDSAGKLAQTENGDFIPLVFDKMAATLK